MARWLFRIDRYTALLTLPKRLKFTTMREWLALEWKRAEARKHLNG